jgi:Ca2+-binding EF-hand superfamily protein
MSMRQKFLPLALVAVQFAVASSTALAYSKRTRATANADARQLIRLFDTDRSGSISKDEFLQFMAQKFDRLDADKSGQLDAKELSSPSPPISKRTDAVATTDVRQLVRLMDADLNGTVSKDEFMKFMSETFDRLDVDKSGALERKELRQLDDPNWLVCHDLHICGAY